MSIKTAFGGLLEKTGEAGKKVVETVKDNGATRKIKKDIGKTVDEGIKNLSIFSERHSGGIVNEVAEALISDLKNRKKAAEKLSLDALKIDIADLMEPLNNQKSSTAEKESIKKMENVELTKIYNSATTTYHTLSEQINELITELEKHDD